MKDFLLIANKNCITYKNVFPLIKDNKIRLGHNNIKEFVMEDGTSKLFGNIGWITTLHTPDKPKLVLTATYSPEKYPKYDNYDAINVDRLKDIPYDYDGVMGVPITILEKELENVEIKGMAAGNSAVNGFGSLAGYTKHKKDRGGCPVLDDERIYTRILIKKNFEIVGFFNNYKPDSAEDWQVYGEPVKVPTASSLFRGPVVNGEAIYFRVLIRRKGE